MIRQKSHTAQEARYHPSHSASQSNLVYRNSSPSSIRPQDSLSDFHEAYIEHDILSASNPREPSDTSSATRRRKRDLLLCHFFLVVTSLVTAVMNAAITIFGMGVGVGLILGDAIRGTNQDPNLDGVNNNSASASDTNTTTIDETVVLVQSETPNCRSTIRRIQGREAHSSPAQWRSNVAATSTSIMPAQ